MTGTLIIAIIGVVIAFVGLLLGCFNTWKIFDKDRIKLKVIPIGVEPLRGNRGGLKLYSTIPIGNKSLENLTLGIEVRNLSFFPVTISDIGFLLFGTEERAALAQIIKMNDGGTFPRVLDAKASFFVYVDRDNLKGLKEKIRCAYAKTTVCDAPTEGNSPVLKYFSKKTG